jgi:hypothetical protein
VCRFDGRSALMKPCVMSRILVTRSMIWLAFACSVLPLHNVHNVAEAFSFCVLPWHRFCLLYKYRAHSLRASNEWGHKNCARGRAIQHDPCASTRRVRDDQSRKTKLHSLSYSNCGHPLKYLDRPIPPPKGHLEGRFVKLGYIHVEF